MKKIIALLLALVLPIGMMAGCSGKSDTVISAAAFSTESVIGLPLNAELNNGDFMTYGGYQFETSKTLERMSDLVVQNNEGVTAEAFENAYGKCVLFSRLNSAGTDNWCLYELDPANMHGWYIFAGTHREFTTKDGSMELLLPLHLISDNYVRDNMGNRLKLETAYACGVNNAELSMEELFCNYYQASGLYSITQFDDGFSILPNQGYPVQLKFTFDERDGSSWFTVTDITERDPEPTENVTVCWTPEDGSEPVTKTLIAEDALQLSALMIRQSYDAGATAVEYPYAIDLDGEGYEARVLWENNAWTGSCARSGNTATLSTDDACELAAILYINAMTKANQTETAIPENTLPMAACLRATTEVNIRFEPSTSGGILRTSVPEEPFAIVGKTGDWYQILMGDQLVYMNADYLQ